MNRRVFILALSFATLFAAVTYAVNPSTPFRPSDNIQDPNCLPTDSNCYVTYGLTTQANGTDLYTDTKTINFGSGLSVVDNSNGVITVTASGGSSVINYVDNSYVGITSGPNGDGSVGVFGSNFIGDDAGLGVSTTYATFSNFFGHEAGNSATNASNSNFFGQGAGSNATNAEYSNFIGNGTGIFASNASNSNFLGFWAGYLATNAANSIFIGRMSGFQDTVNNTATYNDTSTFANTSILIGHRTLTGGFSNSIALGAYAKNTATNQFMLGSSTRPVNQFVINGVNPYLNFSGTAGSSGYGIRNNAGVMEFKDNGGVWTSFGGGTISYGSNSYIGMTSGPNGNGTETTGFYNVYIGDEAGLGAVNVYGSNFIGYQAGNGGTNAYASNFVGISAGYQANYATRSNFIGYEAGYEAGVNSDYDGDNTSTYFDANFIGYQAGYQATDAVSSNFFGPMAGSGATNASYSNFFGYQAGYEATDAGSSNFIGYQAGYQAINANSSNFFGQEAGYEATNASVSNFIGYQAGQGAINATNSNFIGYGAGQGATDAGYSNFIGYQAGQGAINATNSNFIGYGAGQGATTVNGANFMGSYAGINATNAVGAVFLGTQAGQEASDAVQSVFIGHVAGDSAANAAYSVFVGTQAGSGATEANRAIFIGQNSGSFAVNAANAIFIGNAAGSSDTVDNTTDPDDFSILIGHSTSTGGFSNSIALGAYATNTATNQLMVGSDQGVISSVFIGGGQEAASIIDTVFIGIDAGQNASNASYSKFFGYQAGYEATNASYSNFFGYQAGHLATSAYTSNFFGLNAGSGATTADHSNFFGDNAGSGATNASYSNFFGYAAGRSFTGNNVGSNNIIIGTNISLPDSTANALNIGGILFGTDSYSTLVGNPSITAQTAGKIGIATIPSAYTLEVGNSSVAGIVARFQNSTGTCDINPITSSLACSSDETLKKNIQSVENDILAQVLLLNPVTYNWNTESDTDATHTGFIAQEVEALFPDLVFVDPVTDLRSMNYGGLTPYIVKALQEMNLNIIGIGDLERENTWRETLVAWFENSANGIRSLVVKEKVCVDDQCLTSDDIRELLEMKQTLSQPTSGGGQSTDPEPEPEVDPEGEGDSTPTDPESDPAETEDGESPSDPEPAPEAPVEDPQPEPEPTPTVPETSEL